MKSILMAVAMIAVGASLAPTSIAEQHEPKHACNYTSYPVDLHLAVGGRGSEFERTDAVVEAGTCYDFSGLANDARDRVFVSAEARNSPAYRMMQRYTEFTNSWDGRPSWRGGGSVRNACLSNSSASELNVCADEKETITLGEIVGEPGAALTWNILDPAVCELFPDWNCYSADMPALAVRMKVLGQSLANRYAAEFEDGLTQPGIVPTLGGFRIRDDNGPFGLGVVVQDSQSATPLGTPISLLPGDVILSINGEPVFAREDIIMPLIRHGANNGFANPYRIEIQREGKIYEVVGNLYFDPSVYAALFLYADGTCKVPTQALLLAALREASFYTNIWSSCFVDQDNQYAGFEACIFARSQVVAALHQFCGDTYWAGSFAGGMIMPFKSNVEKGVLRVIPGKGIVSEVARTIVVEGIEEAARTAITLPPGVRPSDNLETIERGGVAGAGLAVALNLAVRSAR
jgi:hypothetical protein